MKILLVAFGSHGDVQPIISLGKGLHEAGYEVVLAAGEDFQQHVEGAGLTFRSIDVNIEAMIKTDLGKEWLVVFESCPVGCVIHWALVDKIQI